MEGVFAYCVVDRYHYMVLETGEGYKNSTTIGVRNQGTVPIWCSFADYKCSVYTEGTAVFYTSSIPPGGERQYRLVIDPVPNTKRPCKTKLKTDFVGFLEFNVVVHSEQPDPFDAVGVKTPVYCAFKMPRGFCSKYKIVRSLE
jgi:hypothetical protein